MSERILTNGKTEAEQPDYRDDRGDGQQKHYVVLSESERKKGFVRPYRDAYKHDACGAVTRMGRSIAETYARDPEFYSQTFCVKCGGHFDVEEFMWYEYDGSTKDRLGT